MTVTAKADNGWEIEGLGTLVHPGSKAPLAAAAQAGQGQAVFFSSAPNVALNDGQTANLICAGVAMPKLGGTTISAAGQEAIALHQGTGYGQASSTIANDAFLASDVLAVCYDAGNGVPGKLATYGGYKRSIIGLVLGLAADGTPRVWAGPIASTLARALLLASSKILASHSIADAAASTTTAERAISREALPGLITSIEFVGAAIAADNTDYITITFKKYGSADSYASGTTLGTYDSRAANQGPISAFTPAAFSLSAVAGALNLLADDIVTITVAKGGGGKTLTGAFRVNGKVI